MNEEYNALHRITTRLLWEGNDLLRRLNNPPIHDSTLALDIARWICKAIDDFFPIMPDDAQDFKILSDIKNHYKDNKNILHPEAKVQIQIVLKNVQIAEDWVKSSLSADYTMIPPQNLANIGYAGLTYTIERIEAIDFIKSLLDKEDGRTAKTAMLHIYGRVYMWMRSIIKLNQPENVLALAGNLRAILELFIDLNLFSKEVIENDAEKYFSFPEHAKYRDAKNIVEIRKQLGITKNNSPIEEYLKRVKDVDELRTNLWGKNKNGKPISPQHWTNLNLPGRIQLINDKKTAEIYIESYYYCNQMVHSTYSELTKDLNNVYCFSFHLFNLGCKMFLLSSKLINDKCQVLTNKAFEELYNQIDKNDTKLFTTELVKAARINQKNKQ